MKKWKGRVWLFHIFHVICKISNFNMWTTKHFSEASCTELTLPRCGRSAQNRSENVGYFQKIKFDNSKTRIVKPILINFSFFFLLYFSGVNCPGQSCANELNIEEQPLTVFTNTTSFVGVKAQINPVCKCSSVSHSNRWQSCLPNPCSNNGTCEPLVSGGYKCNCPANNPDQFGPNCQILAATYNGKGMFIV